MKIDLKNVTVRSIRPEEWEDAMDLAWRVFLRFESEDYTPEGVRSFREFVTNETLRRMFSVGDYTVYAAFLQKTGEMIGMVSLRNKTHISLLFVEEKYHLNGVGRVLMHEMKDYVVRTGYEKLTVNASPYAIGFYHTIGFVDTDLEQEREGIRYTPMEWNW